MAYLGRNHMRPVLRSCTALVFIPKYTPASDTFLIRDVYTGKYGEISADIISGEKT
jgi:hypothetical protein